MCESSLEAFLLEQVANVKAGGGAANHNMDLERGSRNSTEALTRGGGGTSSRDSKRPCNPSAKASQIHQKFRLLVGRYPGVLNHSCSLPLH